MIINTRDVQKQKAYETVIKIRKGAGLTKKEGELLTDKMQLPMFDLIELPPKIMNKLRESAIKQGITSYTKPDGKVLTL